MKKITFCGGGSAGHVVPNIAIAEEAIKKYAVSYIGTDGIEKTICQEKNIPFTSFNGVKLVRGKIIKNLSIPFKLVKSVKECIKILKKEKPDLLFCKGGYASLPPALAAHRLKIPILTHESDLSAGLANKIIARKAERILTSFPETAKKFKNGVYTGSPIRKSLFNNSKLSAKNQLGLDLRPTVLVFGGGSGSQKINETLRKILIPLCKKYNVLHICGKGNAVENSVYGYKQIEFCEDMGTAYACADYAVARSGSNSVFEILALKIPCLFIPLANSSTRGDQIENAEYFKAKGLCRVLEENRLTPSTLTSEIESLIADDKIKTALDNHNSECGNKNIMTEIDAILKN